MIYEVQNKTFNWQAERSLWEIPGIDVVYRLVRIRDRRKDETFRVHLTAVVASLVCKLLTAVNGKSNQGQPVIGLNLGPVAHHVIPLPPAPFVPQAPHSDLIRIYTDI